MNRLLSLMGHGPFGIATDPHGYLPTLACALLIIITLLAATRQVMFRKKAVRKGIQFAPVLLDRQGANWGRAPVYKSPLLIRYLNAEGQQSQTVIQPKNIQGHLTTSKKVRPKILVAFCETRQEICTFPFDQIVWAADLKSGDLIDDIYHYLGNAQPGGAPSIDYKP